MDLDEWIFYEHKKNKKFTIKSFAKELGISTNLLSRLVNGINAPTARMAYKIDLFTHGEVSGWGLILKYYGKINLEETNERKS